ncbi:MAG: flagellar basal-body MS-ring/collar protein FliF [Thermodesulfobacteriota bacterium]
MAPVSKQLKGMSSMKLGALMTIAALTAGAIIYLVSWSQRAEYGVLFAGLDPGDAGQIIAKLGDKNIPYKVDGGIISIPGNKVHQTRMELAGDGLPGGGGLGFELFDKGNFGLTDFVQKINFRRAMQGELSRSISRIKGVRSARVHLVMPEKGVFLEEEKKASASIVLMLSPGVALGAGDVKAIVHLVAGGLQNLSPGDVTIVDTEGRLLTPGTDEEENSGFSASQMDYKKRIESDMAARVQSMIERAFGSGNAVARISVELERRRIDRTEEIYDPDSQVVRSEQRTKESMGGAGATGGVPGVLSNVPGKDGKRSSGQGAFSKKEDEVLNYELNKVVKRVVEPFGQVKKLSVSVLVDGSYAALPAGAAEGARRKYIARTPEEISKITAMVKGAVGFNEERGDIISVVNIPFEERLPAMTASIPEEAPPMMERIMPMAVKYGSVGLSVLFLIFFVLRPIIKRLTLEKDALEAIQQSLPNVFEGPERAVLESGTEERIEATEKLKQLVMENPRQAAMVIKGWMQER